MGVASSRFVMSPHLCAYFRKFVEGGGELAMVGVGGGVLDGGGAGSVGRAVGWPR